MRRRMIVLLIGAFVLGVAAGPVLGWERETIVANTNRSSIDERVVRGLATGGWTISRTDQAGSLSLVTFERPRVVGLLESAGDAANDAASRLASATGMMR